MSTRSVPGVSLGSEKATQLYLVTMALSELGAIASEQSSEETSINNLVPLSVAKKLMPLD